MEARALWPGTRQLLLFLGLAIAAFGLRSFGLTETGVGGNDTILYFTLAEHWLEGKFVFQVGDSVQVFRPVLLAFYALALETIGHVDYAIKLANVIVDSINVLLVAGLAWLLSGRWPVSISSALVYVFLPVAVWSARGELPHSLSTFFVLCSFVSAVLALEDRRLTYAFAAISGFSVALATLTHEELILLSIPLGLFLASPLATGDRTVLPRVGLSLACFLAAPICASLLVLKFEGAALNALSAPLAIAAKDKDYFSTLARYGWNVLSGGGSSIFLLLVGIGIVVWIWRLAFKRRDTDPRFFRAYIICMGFFAAFLALYALFVDTVFVRVMLPVLPLPVIAVFFALSVALEKFGRVAAGAVILVLTVVLCVSNIGAYSAFKVSNRAFSHKWDQPEIPSLAGIERGYREFLIDAAYVPSYYTYWGKLYRGLGDRVDAENRALLLPSTAIYLAGRRPLQTRVYYGDNVIYRLDHPKLSLEDLVREFDVRYIVFALGQRRRPPTRYSRYLYGGQWAVPEAINLADEYGMPRYSEQEEFYQVMRLVNKTGARGLSLFPPGSFAEANTRIWELP